MEIALIESGNITRIGDYRTVFPNTSFTSDGPTSEFLRENSAKRVNRFKAYDTLTEQITTCAPYEEGEWVYVVEVLALTQEQIASLKSSAMQQLRAQRNSLLLQSDWTQLVDTPQAIKSSWAAYRQQLRDLPETVLEPRGFTAWPQNPDYTPLP